MGSILFLLGVAERLVGWGNKKEPKIPACVRMLFYSGASDPFLKETPDFMPIFRTELDLIKEQIVKGNYALSPLHLKLVPVDNLLFNKLLSHSLALTEEEEGESTDGEEPFSLFPKGRMNNNAAPGVKAGRLLSLGSPHVTRQQRSASYGLHAS